MISPDETGHFYFIATGRYLSIFFIKNPLSLAIIEAWLCGKTAVIAKNSCK